MSKFANIFCALIFLALLPNDTKSAKMTGSQVERDIEQAKKIITTSIEHFHSKCAELDVGAEDENLSVIAEFRKNITTIVDGMKSIIYQMLLQSEEEQCSEWVAAFEKIAHDALEHLENAMSSVGRAMHGLIEETDFQANTAKEELENLRNSTKTCRDYDCNQIRTVVRRKVIDVSTNITQSLTYYTELTNGHAIKRIVHRETHYFDFEQMQKLLIINVMKCKTLATMENNEL